MLGWTRAVGLVANCLALGAGDTEGKLARVFAHLASADRVCHAGKVFRAPVIKIWLFKSSAKF